MAEKAEGQLTSAERFRRILSFNPQIDRSPVIEWASWWDQTIDRWHGEGLPKEKCSVEDIADYFGLDPLHQVWFSVRRPGCPQPKTFGGAIMEGEDGYRDLKEHFLYGEDMLEKLDHSLAEHEKRAASRGEAQWLTLEGFFWFPRTLFGIEKHLYAFYDEPELMHRINRDLCDYYKKVLPIIFRNMHPQFMTFAEDMSYNHGPMLSEEMYDEFMLPYYRELIPEIQAHGVRVFIDTDGFVEPLIPWFLRAGIEGVLPLERMAGVDVNRIRQNYPHFLMIGGYDKTVMHRGEAAMRAEFERLLPVIRSGGYIVGVDHQTPPDVTIENYRIYLRLLREYAVQAGADLCG